MSKFHHIRVFKAFLRSIDSSYKQISRPYNLQVYIKRVHTYKSKKGHQVWSRRCIVVAMETLEVFVHTIRDISSYREILLTL